MLRITTTCFGFCFLAAFSQPAYCSESRFDGVERIVAISDVHGAYDAMVATLQSADVLDDELRWAGLSTHLVIVGDILDRGSKSRLAMDLLMRLEGEALAAGGVVHVLIGNHEAMLLEGNMRYVSAAEYAAFADDESADERDKWFELYRQRVAGAAEELRAIFMEDYPPGYFAMRRAFRADGQYGKWLLTKNITVVINDTAFVHGGFSPLVTELGLDGINNGLRRDLLDYIQALNALTDAELLLPTDSYSQFVRILRKIEPKFRDNKELTHNIKTVKALADSDLLAPDGPLWYRNNIRCPRIVEQHRVEAALAAVGASRVVVGHTPTLSRKVQQRFDGRVIEIDTGMLNAYYDGLGHALVLQGDSVSVVNQLGDTTLQPVEQLRRVGKRAIGLTSVALKELLLHGEVLSVFASDELLPGQKMVKIGDAENTVSALFSEQQMKGIFPELAAFRMDEMLQLDMVPVTVRRDIEGRHGSLQFIPQNSIDEAERAAAGSGGDAWCSIAEQWPAMYVFDTLIYNENRSQASMLYDTSSWRLMLSRHTKAFGRRSGRPPHLRNATIVVSPGWRDALGKLDDAALNEAMGDVLDTHRLRALKKRRDKLLAAPK